MLLGVEQGFEFAVDEAIEQREADLRAMNSWQLPGMRVGPIRDYLDRPVTKLIARLPYPAPPGSAAFAPTTAAARPRSRWRICARQATHPC